MKSQFEEARVLVIGPATDAQGGIATVLGNYGKMEFWQAFGCRHLATTCDRAARHLKHLSDLRRLVVNIGSLLAGPRPRAISLHTSAYRSFYRKLPYVLISRALGIPIVLHVHSTTFVRFCHQAGWVLQRILRATGRMVDQVVFLSEEARRDLQDFFPLAKSTVVANPVDLRSFDMPRVQRAKSQVLYLGWIVKSKGVYDLLDAVPAVLQSFPDARFIFAGNKEVSELRDLVERRGLQASVDVPGWVDGMRRIDLLRGSTLLVLPSYTEGLPNVILEAMATRLPVITTPVGAIPSVLTDGETSIFVEPGNPRSITNAILKLLGDESLRERMAERAYRHALERYSLEAVSDGLTQIYARYRGPNHQIPTPTPERQ